MLFHVVALLLLLSAPCTLSTSAERQFAARPYANPNIRWVTTVVSSVGVAILLVIMLLVVSHYVIVLQKRREEAGFVDNVMAMSMDAGGEPMSPLPLLSTSDGRKSAEDAARFVYYNKAQEVAESKLARFAGETSAHQREGVKPFPATIEISEV